MYTYIRIFPEVHKTCTKCGTIALYANYNVFYNLILHTCSTHTYVHTYILILMLASLFSVARFDFWWLLFFAALFCPATIVCYLFLKFPSSRFAIIFVFFISLHYLLRTYICTYVSNLRRSYVLPCCTRRVAAASPALSRFLAATINCMCMCVCVRA